jgi:hypothetical protein
VPREHHSRSVTAASCIRRLTIAYPRVKTGPTSLFLHVPASRHGCGHEDCTCTAQESIQLVRLILHRVLPLLVQGPAYFLRLGVAFTRTCTTYKTAPGQGQPPTFQTTSVDTGGFLYFLSSVLIKANETQASTSCRMVRTLPGHQYSLLHRPTRFRKTMDVL